MISPNYMETISFLKTLIDKFKEGKKLSLSEVFKAILVLNKLNLGSLTAKEAIKLSSSLNSLLSETRFKIGGIEVSLFQLRNCISSINEISPNKYLSIIYNILKGFCITINLHEQKEDARLIFAKYMLDLPHIPTIEEAQNTRRILEEKRELL